MPPVASNESTETPAAATDPSAGRTGWIVSPWFDLLFIANLTWLLALLPVYVSPEGLPYFDDYWVFLYLATPHRWMTVTLAALDPDRRYGRDRLFAVFAVLVAVLAGVVLATTGETRALGLFYSIIIAWHFASQHAGILRMYARKAGGGRRWLETWPPRIFVFYVSIRTITGADTLLGFWPSLPINFLDWAIFAIPAGMWAVELLDKPWRRIPKIIYMMSFTGMYASTLLAIHFYEQRLAIAMLAVGTVFHSVEYMAIVTHYAWRRRTRGTPGLFQKIAKRWTAVIVWYVAFSGLVFTFAKQSPPDSTFAVVFLAVNVWASTLHCIYDGFMWKLRDPSTADLLDVEIPKM